MSPRGVAYALQESLRKEQERLQEQHILVPLRIGKTA